MRIEFFLIFLFVLSNIVVSESFAQLLPLNVFQSCSLGKYGKPISLGSWSLEVYDNSSDLCKLYYSFEIEMGYQKYDCHIPKKTLTVIDWNIDYPPISSELIEQYCDEISSGNPYFELAFYWHLAIFAMIVSTIGIGASIFFMIRKVRKQKKSS